MKWLSLSALLVVGLVAAACGSEEPLPAEELSVAAPQAEQPMGCNQDFCCTCDSDGTNCSKCTYTDRTNSCDIDEWLITCGDGLCYSGGSSCGDLGERCCS